MFILFSFYKKKKLLNFQSVQPEVPKRGSSLRNNMDKENTVNKMIQDLESKFSNDFHKVTEFPKPQFFQSLQKVYPSQAKQMANGM